MSDQAIPEKPLALAITTRLALAAFAALTIISLLNRLNTFVTIPFTGDTSHRMALATPDVREVEFRAADGTRLYGWVMGKDSARHRIIFCKGQGGYVGHLLGIRSEQCSALDMQVLVFDYRGYNRSAGRPSEAGTYCDARGAWLFATKDLGWDGRKIIVWGQSLGGAVATKLTCDLLEGSSALWPGWADVQAPAGLVLECPFTCIAEMARKRMGFLGAPEWLSYCSYDNIGRAPALKLPVFHVHGKADEIIPFAQSQALHAAIAGPKRGLWPELSTHNDIWPTAKEEVGPALKQFFVEVTGG
ncbi:MAG: alpha/beta hydrolase [Planctomycetes bacterium]|nr:alpha/beta hydrolase [Planctomycetota bacterium]